MKLNFKVIICLFIFVVASIARLSAYYDYSDTSQRHYIEGLGSGSDSEYQISTAVLALSGGEKIEIFSHYDYLFLVPIVMFFIGFFGFLNGLEALMYFIILLGSLTALIPFLISHRLYKYQLGGFAASLLVAVNPLLVEVAGGRFVLDTTVYFIFGIFLFAYIMAFEKRQIKWLIALGILSVIQGLNKPFLMVNDLPVLLFFPFLFLIEKVSFQRKAPFISAKLYPFRKNFLLGLIPLSIWLPINILFEILHKLFSYKNRFYFLGDLLFSRGNESSVGFALKDSLFKPSTPLNLLITIGTFFSKALTELLLRLNMNIPVLLFVAIMILAIIKSKRHFAVGVLQIPYLVAVALTLTTAISPRHFVTLVIWILVCLALLIDDVSSKFLTRFRPRVYYACLLFTMVLLFGPVFKNFSAFQSRLRERQRETQYYTWIRSYLPADGNILGDGSEDVALLSRVSQRNIIYNSFFGGPRLIPVNATYRDVRNFGDLNQRPMEYGAFLEYYSKNTPYLYVLDTNNNGWRNLLSSGAVGQMPKDKFDLEEVAYNSELKRKVYRLILRK
jgi:hypothetical protein